MRTGSSLTPHVYANHLEDGSRPAVSSLLMSFRVERIRHLYDFSSHFVELEDGLRYHYLDEGRGQPVVMLHGNPSWSFMYRDLIRTLRGRYRVIAPDHIGCGLSDQPVGDVYSHTLEQRVADLTALLDRLSLDRNLTLILHDWGGLIGMAYAARYPNRVCRLVILNTAAFPLSASVRLPRFLLFFRKSPLAAFLILRFNAFSRIAGRFGVRRKSMPAAVRYAYTGPFESKGGRLATLRFIQDIPLSEKDRAYGLIEQTAANLHLFQDKPMLICWGERDPVFSLQFLAEWRRRFPRAEVQRFSQAGHFVLEDVPEQVIPLIDAFLLDPCPAEMDP